MQIKEERMIKVTDDWYPCWNGNEVLLSVFMIYNETKEDGTTYGIAKLMASGMDDFMVAIEDAYDEAYFYDLERAYNEFKYFYDRIPDGVNKQWFFDCGFKEP